MDEKTKTWQVENYRITDLRPVAESGWRVLRVRVYTNGEQWRNLCRLVGWAHVEVRTHTHTRRGEKVQTQVTDWELEDEWQPAYWVGGDPAGLITYWEDREREDRFSNVKMFDVIVLPPGIEPPGDAEPTSSLDELAVRGLLTPAESRADEWPSISLDPQAVEEPVDS